MVLFTKEELNALEHRQRIRLVNSVTGIKPANLIGTISPEGRTNLAIFSSVVHLGTHPPLIGCIVRPDQKVRRHTLENIQATALYTINAVAAADTEQAHQTSAPYEAGVSEFAECRFTEGYVEGFRAPYVLESPMSMGLKLAALLPIPLNDTLLIIGEIQWIRVAPAGLEEDGALDLAALDLAGISGLDAYYRVARMARYGAQSRGARGEKISRRGAGNTGEENKDGSA